MTTTACAPSGNWWAGSISSCTTLKVEETHAAQVTPGGVNILDSAAVEDVLILRDEPAEMAWGVERTVVGTSGRPSDRALVWRTTQPPIVPPSSTAVASYSCTEVCAISSQLPVPEFPVPESPV